MRMLARPPVAVTAVLHLGDSWKQALILTNLRSTKRFDSDRKFYDLS